MANGSVTIREMDIDDIALVFHMGEHLFTAREVPNLYRTWDEYEVVNLFQTDGEYCLVAEKGDKVVGFALGTTIEKNRSSWRYGYLLWMGVDPEQQGDGVGQRLFSKFHELMLAAGVRILIVDTEADNEEALRFFDRLGFTDPQEHIYLSLNIDDERREYEERLHARQVRRAQKDEDDGCN